MPLAHEIANNCKFAISPHTRIAASSGYRCVAAVVVVLAKALLLLLSQIVIDVNRISSNESVIDSNELANNSASSTRVNDDVPSLAPADPADPAAAVSPSVSGLSFVVFNFNRCISKYCKFLANGKFRNNDLVSQNP